MQLINDPGNNKMALAPKKNIDNAKCTDLFKEIYLHTDQEVQVLEEGCKVRITFCSYQLAEHKIFILVMTKSVLDCHRVWNIKDWSW
jgi:hypothetical protein